MLTAAGCQNRRGRLWDRLDDKPDWIVISDPRHLMYFANYFQSPFVFRSVNAGAILVLGRDRSSTLVADNLVGEFATGAHVDERVTPVWYRGRESAVHREAKLVESALEILGPRPGEHIGLEAAKLPAGIIEGLRAARGSLKLTNIDSVVHELKRSKDADEMEVLRRSMRAGEAGHAAAMKEIRPGMSELEAYLIIQQAAIRDAGQQAMVYGDFVTGPRCESGGGPPTDRIIEEGDLVLLDFSVVIDGYRGDIANAFRCGAAATDRQRQLCQACLDAMAAAERLVHAGRACREIDTAVRDSFADKHLAENFKSHSGHGLGLGHPDPPYLVQESADTLLAGDVIAIEPSQLIPGEAGMRFERNYLVTDDGYELLSHHALRIDARE